jgi:hypothetical protein
MKKKLQKYYLDGLRKLRETSGRLLKRDQRELKPNYAFVPHRDSPVVKNQKF